MSKKLLWKDISSTVGAEATLPCPPEVTPLEGNPDKWRYTLSLLTLLAGISLFIYPTVATLINNQAHQELVKKVLDKTSKLSKSEMDKEIEKAQEYNKTMTNGPFLDPFAHRVIPNSEQYQKYSRTLNLSDGVMGSIHIPAIKVELPIYHGASDATLDKGAGHLFGSSLPVGGSNTKTVITAHSGLGNASMFDDLRYIKKGDAVFFNIGQKTLKYEVYGQKVVHPDQSNDLHIEHNKDLAVLITCTPYGINTHRLLVFAKRIPYVPEVDDQIAKEHFESPWRFWMYLTTAAVIVSLLLYFRLVVFWRRRKEAKAQLSVLPRGEKDGTDEKMD